MSEETVPRGWLFAVCCKVDIPSELMNRMLDETYSFFKHREARLVVVDDLDREYTEPTEPPLDSSVTPAVFRGKSPEECAAAVKALVAKTGSNINYELFAILDERTLRDYTVLLCENDDEAREVETVRAAADITGVKLTTWDIGSSSLSEDRGNAEGDVGNVLRMERPTPRDPPPPPPLKKNEPESQSL